MWHLAELSLNNGRQIFVDRVYQQPTWDDYIIGKITQEKQERKLKWLKQFASTLSPAPVHLLTSVNLDERLPVVACIVEYSSDSLAGTSSCGSHLVLIHFQEEMTPFLSAENNRLLQAIAWDDLAVNFDY